MNRLLHAMLALPIALVVLGTSPAVEADVNGCGDGSCVTGFFGESDQTCPLDCGCASAPCGEQPSPPGSDPSYGWRAPFGCWCDAGCKQRGNCCADSCWWCGNGCAVDPPPGLPFPGVMRGD